MGKKNNPYGVRNLGWTQGKGIEILSFKPGDVAVWLLIQMIDETG